LAGHCDRDKNAAGDDVELANCQNRRVTGYIVRELAQSYYRKDVRC